MSKKVDEPGPGMPELNVMQLLLGQAHFRVDFFEKHPECKGCEYVDILAMDYWLYPSVRERRCKVCEKFKG